MSSLISQVKPYCYFHISPFQPIRNQSQLLCCSSIATLFVACAANFRPKRSSSHVCPVNVEIPIPCPDRLSLIPEILFLVEQIRSRTTQIYNLRAPVSVLLQSRALEAVEGV
jgi:hypothetical protein